jgi:FlaA1/EpsC-like NDP-sugar epimerase
MSRRTLSLLVWLIVDALLFVGSYALAYFLRVGPILSTDFPFDRFIGIALLMLPAWLAMLIMTRTFALMRRQTSLRVGSYLAAAAVVSLALFTLTYFFAYGLFFSRLLLVYACILSFALPWVWHMVWDALSRAWLRGKTPVYPTLIVGATREAASLIRLLNEHHNPLKPVAILDGKGSKESALEGVPVEGKLNKLEETLTKHRITHLIQCSDLEQSINLLSACRQRGITYLLLPSVLGMLERDERIESLEGIPVTTVRPQKGIASWFFN